MTGARRPPRPAAHRTRGASSGRGARPGREQRSRVLRSIEEPTVAAPEAGPEPRSETVGANPTRRREHRGRPRSPVRRRTDRVVELTIVPDPSEPEPRRSIRTARRSAEPAHRNSNPVPSGLRRIGARAAPIGPGGIRRRHVIAAAVILGVFGVLGYQIIAGPLQQWRDQRNEIDAAERRLEEVRAERRWITEQIDAAGSESEIRRSARELFEMVDPGEELVIVVPEPVGELGLPGTWPFTGVERELGAG